jgi:hypothetical protein
MPRRRCKAPNRRRTAAPPRTPHPRRARPAPCCAPCRARRRRGRSAAPAGRDRVAAPPCRSASRQPRSRSTSARLFKKQHTSSSSPENSGPTASRARCTRCRAPSTASVKPAALAPRAPSATAALQFAVMRGISCARVNSARSRSPASSWIGSISGRPSRPLRRASQISGLSASSTVTAPTPSIWRRATSRCWARKRSISGSGADD